MAPVATPGLPAVRDASTWPRGWMAAAVPQRVREFHTQISKAQMAAAYLESLREALDALAQACRHQRQLPSDAGLARLRAALAALQQRWRQRHARSLASLDDTLHWTPTHRARKSFVWNAWSWDTLQAETAQDQELLGFCLLGQDGAQGAWQADEQRSPAGNAHALAQALAPLGILVGRVEQALLLSVDEAAWPVLQQRLMVKGNGKRFPAGQWVAPRLQSGPQALGLERWSAGDAEAVQACSLALPAARERVSQALAVVHAFQQQAGHSLPDMGPQLAAMQHFAQTFADAGQAPVYDWVLAVVPAVRAIARRRVARLLQSRGMMG